jgi:hypothetical protein
MNSYTLVLFVHIASDITLFTAIGAQVLTLHLLQQAGSVAQARILLGMMPLTNRIGVGGALLTIGSGIYLAVSVWGLPGWIQVTLASLILFLPPLVAGIIEPRLHALIKMVHGVPEGPLPPSLHTQIRDPLLRTALSVDLGVVLGIVFLMTTKPPLPGAIATMAVALLLAFATALPEWYRHHRDSRSGS